MMIKEHIYKVSYRLTPKATILRHEYIKAYDHDHAMRITKNLFRPRGAIEKVEKVNG
jgi:hypothetical protein